MLYTETVFTLNVEKFRKSDGSFELFYRIYGDCMDEFAQALLSGDVEFWLKECYGENAYEVFEKFKHDYNSLRKILYKKYGIEVELGYCSDETGESPVRGHYWDVVNAFVYNPDISLPREYVSMKCTIEEYD